MTLAQFSVRVPIVDWFALDMVDLGRLAHLEQRFLPDDVPMEPRARAASRRQWPRPWPCLVGHEPFADLMIFHRERLSEAKCRRLLEAQAYLDSRSLN